MSSPCKEAELRDDEDADELENIGMSLIAVYMTEAAPSIQLATVELEWKAQLAASRRAVSSTCLTQRVHH